MNEMFFYMNKNQHNIQLGWLTPMEILELEKNLGSE